MPVFSSFLYTCTARCRAAGFTLAELLLVIAVIGVIAAVAVPAFSDVTARSRVRSATESIHGLIVQARSEGPIRDVNLSLSVNTGHWCIGVAASPGCDCTLSSGSGACVLDVAGSDVLHTVTAAEFPEVSVSENFPGVGTTFNRLRGTATPAGKIVVSSSEQVLEIRVGLTGRVRVCTPAGSAMTGYPGC